MSASEMRRGDFLKYAAGAAAMGLCPSLHAEEDAIATWQRETDMVSADVYKAYMNDGDTRGLASLEKLEAAYAKVARELDEAEVGGLPDQRRRDTDIARRPQRLPDRLHDRVRDPRRRPIHVPSESFPCTRTRMKPGLSSASTAGLYQISHAAHKACRTNSSRPCRIGHRTTDPRP